MPPVLPPVSTLDTARPADRDAGIRPESSDATSAVPRIPAGDDVQAPLGLGASVTPTASPAVESYESASAGSRWTGGRYVWVRGRRVWLSA